jgi:AraC-like DNA-binding protein
VQLLRSQIIPWTTPGARNGIFVAQAKMRAVNLPEGVTMTRRKITGRRIVIKNTRRYDNKRLYIAEWPEANLQELAVPKIACIVSGIADYLLGDCCVHCGPGTFILLPPRVPHHRHAPNLLGDRLRNGSCALLHALAYQHGVHFWYSRSINERSINEMTDNYLLPDMAAVQTLHLLTDEAAAKKPGFESIASGFLGALFAIIAREIEAGNYVHPNGMEDASAPALQAASFAQQVREYIEANYHKQPKVEDVATRMYMSSAQFYRRMRQETGVTFVEMLTSIRIERACKMLRETDFTFNTIAIRVGFRSSTHFHSLFRSRMGCTPVEYRHQPRPDQS